MKALKKNFDEANAAQLPGSIERFWSKEAFERFGPPRDTHYDVGKWFDANGIAPVLDIGCGQSGMAKAMSGRVIGLDGSISQLQGGEGARLQGDALSLPFAEGTFPGAALLYILYFFEDPHAVVAEAMRALRPGGVLAVCAPSRYDAPELAAILPDEESEAFASEDIADVMGGLVDIQVNEWDFPMLRLETTDDVRDYVYSWYFPRLTLEEAQTRAETITVPTPVTKRGAWATARKPR
ncbi:MAG: class I SAM-dependent methyltransferase [Actinomycetota bacterium]